ncbi:MAG: hypothetical protein ABI904_10350 [Chloroflexota bacterium]
MQGSEKEIQNLLVIFFAVAGAFVFGVWFLVDTWRIRQFSGNIKRGQKIWSRELPDNSWQYLLSLRQDVLHPVANGRLNEFIRVQGNEILVFSQPEKIHSTWLCVGFVNRESPLREIEYRMSLPGIIFLLPFTLFGVLIFLVSFISYRKAIDSFIERNLNEQNLKPSTFQPSNTEAL